MIETPWSYVLTATFLVTAVLCALHLARGRVSTAGEADLMHAGHHGPAADVIHLNHLVMSLAMLLMVWRPVGTAGTWVQVVIFALLAVLMLMGLPAGRGTADRASLLGHVLLNAAMIWMLLAMPLLMGQSMGGAEDPHAAHHGGGSGEAAMGMMAPTPAWVDAVNVAAVVLSGVVAVGWSARLLGGRTHRVHSACHLLMGAGMAIMLALM